MGRIMANSMITAPPSGWSRAQRWVLPASHSTHATAIRPTPEESAIAAQTMNSGVLTASMIHVPTGGEGG